jgi:hypothetical protein
MPDDGTEHNLNQEKCFPRTSAGLAKLYNVNVEGIVRSVHPYKCPLLTWIIYGAGTGCEVY